MRIIVLRKGPEWRSHLEKAVVDRFHAIAEQNGSHACWLPQTGVLATDDPDEGVKNFPYDDWRKSAAESSGECMYP